uniref:Uncharacterized protein n=1 Tax=Lactuca sativa TaxID=4236 RepID=A0A9R1WC40_LACSA|nr:hypothetical protein LSAT_V11C300146340 [Lactuca sativa]
MAYSGGSFLERVVRELCVCVFEIGREWEREEEVDLEVIYAWEYEICCMDNQEKLKAEFELSDSEGSLEPTTLLNLSERDEEDEDVESEVEPEEDPEEEPEEDPDEEPEEDPRGRTRAKSRRVPCGTKIRNVPYPLCGVYAN